MKWMSVLIVALSLLVASPCSAKKSRTTRNVKPAATTELPVGPQPGYLIPEGEVASLTGYDKPLRSSRESLFVVSSFPDTIVGLIINLTYFDMGGHRLHSRDVEIETKVPPGESQRIEFPSWDTQKSFYYKLSAPLRSTNGTPYDVKAEIVRLLTAPSL